MATETEPAQTGFEADRGLRLRRLKGRLFEVLLVASTLVGIAALVVLFTLIGLDAFGLTAAEPTWYLVYFAVLVMPMSGYTLYARRNPAVADVNARAFMVTLGGLVGSLALFAVADAFGPTDVAIFFLGLFAPPAAVLGYARRFGESHLTGPAVPISILVGLGAAAALHGVLFAVLDPLLDWIMYYLFVAVPAAAILGVVAQRRLDDRYGLPTAGIVAIGSAVVGFTGSRTVVGSELGLVLFAGFLAPVGYLVVDTVANERKGRLGLLGPALLAAGILVGATLEAQLGITGLDSWLNPTLLLESWSDFRPEQAGIYPQLVGSMMIVGIMTFLAFPVGVGAAIYLEEYAPESGFKGRLASVLDVNISNLAGVPSVVYGLLGLALFREVFGLTPGIVIAGSITLGLLILPIVVVAAQEALRSVPDELRQASYGLGASRWQTVRNVVLPEAVPGILTGTILALGRAIGETAPLVMLGLATTRFSVPDGLFSAAAALPLQIFAAKGNNIPEYRTGVVAAASIILLVLLLAMNATAIIIRNRYQREDTQ